MWNLVTGILAANKIEEIVKPLGYHCALGGSVLHSGSSDKDLDIFVYPHNASIQNADPIFIAGKIHDVIGDGVHAAYECNQTASCPRDDKTVFVVTTKAGRRIDLFFVQ